jgi:hypothetical protein
VKSFARSQSGGGFVSPSTENPRPQIAVNRQPSLFESTPLLAPGSLNDASLVRNAVIESIRECGKSRAQLADEMSRLTGTEVTVRRLNAFTAESREDYRFPAELLRALCIATGSHQLLRCLVAESGFFMISRAENDLLELGREYLKQKRAADHAQLLERRLEGFDL